MFMMNNNLHLKENPFKVPEGYFTNVKESVMQQISTAHTVQREQETIFTILKPALSMAAMFAIIFGLGYLVLTATLPSATSGSTLYGENEVTLTDEDMLYFIGKSVDYQMLLEEEELNSINITHNTYIDKDINAIEQYLIDSNTPYSIIASIE